MGPRFFTVEDSSYNYGKGRNTLNAAVLDWNQRYQFLDVYRQLDTEMDTDMYECVYVLSMHMYVYIYIHLFPRPVY